VVITVFRKLHTMWFVAILGLQRSLRQHAALVLMFMKAFNTAQGDRCTLPFAVNVCLLAGQTTEKALCKLQRIHTFTVLCMLVPSLFCNTLVYT
jgi:hypothetical protein